MKVKDTIENVNLPAIEIKIAALKQFVAPIYSLYQEEFHC